MKNPIVKMKSANNNNNLRNRLSADDRKEVKQQRKFNKTNQKRNWVELD